ncbi:hypothetical protein ARMSODRAFT_1020089 [Armillaria solidipes]|uniref:Peptidase C14 caspase domain-containing protein n=1 Tax=Armillaria solidipes TaxID=1076256 RepID=A0A2H3BEG6_9AGAR|nr:hypothetical protein ARMSODRAFT_1020089 [Armillaria solidipes]
MSNSEADSPTTEFIDDKHDTQIEQPSDCKTEVNEGTASDDQVNTEQLSSSSPRSASGECGETLQSESHHDDSERNGFAPPDYSYSPPNPNDLKIRELEQREADLAKAYGMPGPDIDTDAVLQETKNRAKSDSRYNASLDMLHELYRFRSHLARPREPRSENGRPSAESILSQATRWGIPRDVSRIWALIIGINKYHVDLKPLNGCINDGYLMNEYITKDLGVPQDHVRCLFDEHATRAGILSALEDLYTNTRIHRGDIIIIYFAGHGASYLCSGHHENEFGEKVKPQQSAGRWCPCPVEAICPVDRGDYNPHFPSGKVPDIDDREINTHLSRLSRAKGYRITVILDCCHSGGATREDSDTVARSLPPLSRAVYDDMRSYSFGSGSDFSDWIPSVPEEEWRPDMSCHVVIAACRGHQTTGERESEETGISHGIFTRVLVETLRYLSSVQLTYVLLLDALPVQLFRWQTPVVAGDAKGKLLWSQEDQETISGPATIFFAGNAQTHWRLN